MPGVLAVCTAAAAWPGCPPSPTCRRRWASCAGRSWPWTGSGWWGSRWRWWRSPWRLPRRDHRGRGRGLRAAGGPAQHRGITGRHGRRGRHPDLPRPGHQRPARHPGTDEVAPSSPQRPGTPACASATTGVPRCPSSRSPAWPTGAPRAWCSPPACRPPTSSGPRCARSSGWACTSAGHRPRRGWRLRQQIVLYPELFIAPELSLRLGRPVRFTLTRSEAMVLMSHGRAQINDVEVGFDDTGKLLALRVHTMQDEGRTPTPPAWGWGCSPVGCPAAATPSRSSRPGSRT